MKTILYLNATGEISGAERSLLAMLDALDRDRWSPAVAAPEGPLLREARARGAATRALVLPLLRRPTTTRALWDMLAMLRAGWREVSRAIGELRPDLLHANTTPAMLYAVRANVPVIWQVRDLIPLGPIAALLYRRAARVAAISTAVRDEIQRAVGDAHKIVLLPPAVDTDHFRPAQRCAELRTELGLPGDVPLLGMIAQFVPWKRHTLFLTALEQLADRPWHAVLAGADLHHDTALDEEIRARLAQPSLAGRVTWLPWQEDPARLLAALDLCVLTSEHEPFGRVLIEAMACAVPVVAMDDGGGPCDIVLHGQTGLLVPPGPAAIAAAIAGMLDDPERRHCLGHAARLRAETCFSVIHQKQSLNSLYALCNSAVHRTYDI